MKNVILYSRVSSDEQAEGYSLTFQEDAMRRYCAHKGYYVLESFVEDHSAKDFNRPKWKQLISYIKTKNGKKFNSNSRVDSVLCLRWDRFSRNLKLSLNVMSELKELGVEVETVETQIDTTSPESLLLQAISLALPQIENEKISRRSCEGSHEARLEGCFTGTPPRGYVNCRTIDDSATLSITQDGELIKQAFEKMASGLHSADEIRRWLNLNGIKIGKNQFYNVIRNVTYTGKIYVKPFRGEPAKIVPGLHPPLISDELFAAANDVLSGRRRNMKFKKDKSDLYPLKGFLECSIHGRALSAYGAKGRKDIYHYYVCTKFGGSQCPRYPINWAHKEIENILSQIQFSAKTLIAYRSILEVVFEGEKNEKKKIIDQLNLKLQNIETRKKRISGDYMDGKLSSIDYQELKMQLDSESFETNAKLKEIMAANSPYREYLNKHVPLLENLLDFYQKSNGETKKKILGCIFSRKVQFVDSKAAAIEFTPAIQILTQITNVLDKSKTKKEIKNDLLQLPAPPAGLEPATL